MFRQWLLAALAVQFLAAYRAYRDEHNEHVGLHVLQADLPMKSEADQNDHSSRAIQTEKEAMAELANIWFPAIDISNTMDQCGASTTKKDNFNVSDSGFTFQCQNRSVVTLAIKEGAPNGAFTVEILNRALRRLPNMEEVILDGSKLTGHLNSLNLSCVPNLQRLHMRWCNMEGTLQHLKKCDLKYLKLSGINIKGSLQDLQLHQSSMKMLDLQGTSVTGSVSDDLPNSLEGLW